jgi:hypothetical protein
MANKRQITVSCAPEWDEEVDVVCTDSGMAGWATAISAIDADVEVFLADATGEHSVAANNSVPGWFGFGDDEANAEYRGELTADLDPEALAQRGPDLPVRRAGELVPVRRRPRPPFVGPLLRQWTADCITASSGFLYTQVTDWTSETMDCGDGDVVRVTEIGSMTPDLDDPVGSVVEWLSDEALDRGVSAYPVRRFDRLVFEDGAVIGAVFTTDSGPLAIRAHHGVLVCRKETSAADDFSRSLSGSPTVRVALIGKDASRFGRVELLTSDAPTILPAPSAVTVTPSRS